MTRLRPNSLPPQALAAASREDSSAVRSAWAFGECRRLGIRLTHAREHILQYLSDHAAPVTWEAMTEAPELRACCDPATIARTLALFQEAELVRVVTLPGKARHFLLNAPGPERGFLVCQRCGAWSEFGLDRAVLRSVETSATTHGFCWNRHELLCHGLCRACAQVRRSEPASHKLKVR
jgi:Fe2+ or Zn2+ uptake regulation protein